MPHLFQLLQEMKLCDCTAVDFYTNNYKTIMAKIATALDGPINVSRGVYLGHKTLELSPNLRPLCQASA